MKLNWLLSYEIEILVFVSQWYISVCIVLDYYDYENPILIQKWYNFRQVLQVFNSSTVLTNYYNHGQHNLTTT